MALKPFKEPIYITRPYLPDLEKYSQSLKEVWASGKLANVGPLHIRLEEKLQETLRAPYLSLFNNGTIALITACQSIRLQGEVITTPFSFPATPHVLTWNNIRPIFADIEYDTMNLDAEKIESLITPRTTAILPVHVFGVPCDVEKIQEIANRYGLRVVYDAAHAFGVEINGIPICNFGDISMLSFHATKMFHTAEGGALIYGDSHLKPRIELLKNFGIKNEEEVVMPGINGKMNELQAALGLLVLEGMEGEMEKRRLLRETYAGCLRDVPGLHFTGDVPGVKSNYQYFVLKIDEREFGRPRDYVYHRFKEYNVFTRMYFYPLCSDYPCYRQLPSSAPENLPVAARVAREVLCLPLYGGLTGGDVEKICGILKEFGKGA